MTERTPSAPDCRDVIARLFEFIDNELPDADRDAIQSHVEACRPCLSECDLDRLLKALVHRSCHERAPVELRQRVLFSIRQVQLQIGLHRPE